MNIKVTMSKLQEIIKEELDMIDVSDDIVEEDDDESYKIDNAVVKYLTELEKTLKRAKEIGHDPEYFRPLKAALIEWRRSYYHGSEREKRPLSIYK